MKTKGRSDTSPIRGGSAGAGARASRRGLIGAGLVAALGTRAAQAADAISDDNPFADHRLALQLSDRGADKRALVLSVANNVLKEYGPDRIAVEVVAFGPGIDLLRAGSPDRQAVDSLIAQGVRFAVCMNTVQTIERETGKKLELNPQAQPVTAGVPRLVLLAERGYTIVRP